VASAATADDWPSEAQARWHQGSSSSLLFGYLARLKLIGVGRASSSPMASRRLLLWLLTSRRTRKRKKRKNLKLYFKK